MNKIESYLKEMNDILEPLKVENALKSEEMKLNYRKKHKPKDVNILDYTIIEALKKQIPYKLTQIDEETLTGICKCGRVTDIIDCESYCKYCGQKVTK